MKKSLRHRELGSPRRLARRPTLAALVLALLVAASVPAEAAQADDVASIPVAFAVTNTNTSGAPCPADGAAYTVRGHLTGRQSVLKSRNAAVTLYLHGLDGAEWNWTFDAVPGYDFAARMARAGHVSLTIDELGYGASDHPTNGNLTCVGAQADVAHQIVQQLRAGSYQTAVGGRPFATVMIAGHDVGGLIAEVEAAAFGGIDALIEVTWSDQGHTPFIVERSTTASAQWCATGGNTAQPNDDYVHFATEEDWRTWVFHDADPAVVAASDEIRNTNPCGVIRSLASTTTSENPYSLKAAAGLDPGNSPVTRLGTITVPVLIVFGADDTQLWTRQGEDEQVRNFPTSHDTTTVYIPAAAHFPMLEKSAPQFSDVLSKWLRAHAA